MGEVCYKCTCHKTTPLPPSTCLLSKFGWGRGESLLFHICCVHTQHALFTLPMLCSHSTCCVHTHLAGVAVVDASVRRVDVAQDNHTAARQKIIVYWVSLNRARPPPQKSQDNHTAVRETSKLCQHKRPSASYHLSRDHVMRSCQGVPGSGGSAGGWVRTEHSSTLCQHKG